MGKWLLPCLKEHTNAFEARQLYGLLFLRVHSQVTNPHLLSCRPALPTDVKWFSSNGESPVVGSRVCSLGPKEGRG